MAAAEMIIWASAIGLFAVAWVGGRWAPPIALAVAPLIWLVAAIVFVARGQVNSVRDVLIIAAGFFLILIVSGAGRNARAKAQEHRSRP
ncbi:MAG: hypothetical protein AAGC80_03445 [Rhodococcus sp. (in: high G+C Gram-positive bacteria)]